MPDAPRTGDEWLRTRPIEEQREEYTQRAAADVVEARTLAADSSLLVRWYREWAASRRAPTASPEDTRLRADHSCDLDGSPSSMSSLALRAVLLHEHVGRKRDGDRHKGCSSKRRRGHQEGPGDAAEVKGCSRASGRPHLPKLIVSDYGNCGKRRAFAPR
jgi:hypothetical protein